MSVRDPLFCTEMGVLGALVIFITSAAIFVLFSVGRVLGFVSWSWLYIVVPVLIGLPVSLLWAAVWEHVISRYFSHDDTPKRVMSWVDDDDLYNC